MRRRPQRAGVGVMNALVVYESMYGNTRAIAEAIADGLDNAAETTVRPVHQAGVELDGIDLLVVGGPTHMHGLATGLSRRASAQAAQEDGLALEPGATEEPGLRSWLRELPRGRPVRSAAFDTRADKAAALTGSAARGIARRLRHRGYDVVARESFLVEDSEEPLAAGEAERARAWGAELAAR
jgi:hypothetical protein